MVEHEFEDGGMQCLVAHCDENGKLNHNYTLSNIFFILQNYKNGSWRIE